MVSKQPAEAMKNAAAYRQTPGPQQPGFIQRLYAAVLALQATEGDHCPACDTPLAGQLHVVVNPYIKATDGLAELKELGELQEERETVQAEVATASRALRRQLATLAAFVAAKNEQDTPVGQYLAGLAAEPAEDWWTAIFPARQKRYQCYGRRRDA